VFLVVLVQQIVNAINILAPWDLAESWDHVGLQIGGPNRKVERVLLAVDLNREVLEEALSKKVNGLVVHHPLLFRPLFQVNPETAAGFYLSTLIKNDLFLIAAHTNLDKAEHGLNGYLADLLDIQERSPIEPVAAELCKIVVFIPENHLNVVREAMSQAGAGVIGNYNECSFELRGQGTFRPNWEARPLLGEVDRFETVAETRLEMIANQKNLSRIIKAIYTNHPYEEPAVDVYPLLNSSPHGLGCIGNLEQPITFGDLLDIIQRKLAAKGLRVCGESQKKIKRLAICTGSGGSLLSKVIGKGADAYLTGEMGYHDFQAAKDGGVAVIEAGHWTTENCFIPLVIDYLRKQFTEVTFIPAVSTRSEPYQIVNCEG
jgi:dinuclear metal center YbgI/SA1388 family protein